MNFDISLQLELIDQGDWGFLFRMTVQNHSHARLFLPFPEIVALEFEHTCTLRKQNWFTSLLVSAAFGGFVLEPERCRSIDWRVRPGDVQQSELNDHSDYYRWCLELPPGEYRVRYLWKVDEDYFDPNSHAKMPQLVEWANFEQAAVWQGQVKSNSLRVVRS